MDICTVFFHVSDGSVGYGIGLSLVPESSVHVLARVVSQGAASPFRSGQPSSNLFNWQRDASFNPQLYEMSEHMECGEARKDCAGYATVISRNQYAMPRVK